MNTNTSIVVPPAAMPTRSEMIVSKSGNNVGVRGFLGSKSASEIKDECKALGLKGDALKQKVNECLSSDAANRKICAYAAIEHAHTTLGLLPDVVELRKNSGSIKLVGAGTTAVSAVKAELDAEKAKNAALMARLEALEAAANPVPKLDAPKGK